MSEFLDANGLAIFVQEYTSELDKRYHKHGDSNGSNNGSNNDGISSEELIKLSKRVTELENIDHESYKSADAQVLTNAKTYTDGASEQALAEAKTYADGLNIGGGNVGQIDEINTQLQTLGQGFETLGGTINQLQSKISSIELMIDWDEN